MNDIKFSRRGILRLAALGALSAFVAACQRAVAPIIDTANPAPVPTKELVTQGTPPDVQATTGSVPITQAKDFYITSYSSSPSTPANWKLTIAGLVDKPLTLTLDDIKAIPSITEMRTISCISNPVGGDLISNAEWKGVRFKDLLAQVGVKNNARFIKLESFDGWFTGIPLDLGMNDHSLLVYEMNGAAIPRDHGAPLRCFWPGHYGMKQPKWLQAITLVDAEFSGYWERQGWSNEARVRPFSRIDTPQDLAVITGDSVTLSGIAYADDSGLAKLEISWDDTNQWLSADLTRGPSPLTWIVWKWSGKALPTGRHTLYARATDGRGEMQMRGTSFNLLGGTFPNGTANMHSIVLDFKS